MSINRAKLAILPRAAEDITEQANYYLEQANGKLAQRWKAAVADTMQSLHRFPEGGSPVLSDIPALRKIRRLRVEGFPNHFIFYEFDSERNTIYVVNVLHGARDLDPLLG